MLDSVHSAANEVWVTSYCCPSSFIGDDDLFSKMIPHGYFWAVLILVVVVGITSHATSYVYKIYRTSHANSYVYKIYRT